MVDFYIEQFLFQKNQHKNYPMPKNRKMVNYTELKASKFRNVHFKETRIFP